MAFSMRGKYKENFLQVSQGNKGAAPPLPRRRTADIVPKLACSPRVVRLPGFTFLHVLSLSFVAAGPREKVGQAGEGLRGRVFKEAVVGVEHLLGEEEEPLPGHAAVVQALLRLELDPQPRLQHVGPLEGHDAAVRLLEDVGPVQLHLKAVGNVSLGIDRRMCQM